MEVKPLKRYKDPSYPVKQEVLLNPLLLKSMPERWKGNLAVGIALTSLLAITATGCSTDKAKLSSPMHSVHSQTSDIQTPQSTRMAVSTGDGVVDGNLATSDSTTGNPANSTGFYSAEPSTNQTTLTGHEATPGFTFEFTPQPTGELAPEFTSGPALEPAMLKKYRYWDYKNNVEVETQKVVPSNDDNIAPVFVHGGGRGSFGCVSVAPPAFLSEDEAFEVIQEEARRYGVIFSKDALKIEDVFVPAIDLNSFEHIAEGEEGASIESGYTVVRKGNLELDGSTADKEIAFEFVSVNDLKDWEAEIETLDEDGKYTRMMSTVEEYNCFRAAKSLREGIGGKTGETKVGIFYDPMPDYTEEQYKTLLSEYSSKKRISEEQKETAKQLLREQVIDFLNWLKAQGVI